MRILTDIDLANLFMDYTFDKWMQRNYPKVLWARYADDGLVHCRSLQEAKTLLTVLNSRFEECGLELHPDKTRIVYCKDEDRPGGEEQEIKFEVLFLIPTPITVPAEKITPTKRTLNPNQLPNCDDNDNSL